MSDTATTDEALGDAFNIRSPEHEQAEKLSLIHI